MSRALTSTALICCFIALLGGASTTGEETRPAIDYVVEPPRELNKMGPDGEPEYYVGIYTAPAVVNRRSVFMVYFANGNGPVSDYVKQVSPENPEFNAPGRVTGYWGDIQVPIPIAENAAIVDTLGINSTFTVLTTDKVLHEINRHGSQARVTWAPDRKLAFVPVGIQNHVEELRAYDLTTVVASSAGKAEEEEEKLFWHQPFPAPESHASKKDVADRKNFMSDPIYYQGKVYVMVDNKLHAFHAEDGSFVNKEVFPKADPCGYKAYKGKTLNVALVKGYSVDEEGKGPLDAMIVYGDTSVDGDSPREEFSFCSINPDTAEILWHVELKHSLKVDTEPVYGDGGLTGGGGYVMLQGSRGSDGTYVYVRKGVSSADAISKDGEEPVYVMKVGDGFALPFVLPTGHALEEVCKNVVLITAPGRHNNLTAFCLDKRPAKAPFFDSIWTSPVGCKRTPVLTPDGHLVCNDDLRVTETEGAELRKINIHNGDIIWTFPEQMSSVQVVDGNIWATSYAGTLYGIDPVRLEGEDKSSQKDDEDGKKGNSAASSPSDQRGVSTTTTVALVCAFLILGLVAGAAAVAYGRRTRRRSPVGHDQVLNDAAGDGVKYSSC